MSHEEKLEKLEDNLVLAVKEGRISARAAVRQGYANKRAHIRRTVLWSAKIIVGTEELKSTLFDISLGGARVKSKMTLPLDEKIRVQIKDYSIVDAQVVWCDEGFIGLKFTAAPEEIKEIFGDAIRDKK
jgi:c-di-GMP-binding flagellar brake protein YcgR